MYNKIFTTIRSTTNQFTHASFHEKNVTLNELNKSLNKTMSITITEKSENS